MVEKEAHPKKKEEEIVTTRRKNEYAQMKMFKQFQYAVYLPNLDCHNMNGFKSFQSFMISNSGNFTQFNNIGSGSTPFLHANKVYLKLEMIMVR